MRKWNSLAVVGIVCLLILGYSIPSVVMTMEDEERESILKSYEIEEMVLDFQNTDIIKEIAIFPELLSNHIVVEKADILVMTKSEETDNHDTQANSESEDGDRVWIEDSIENFFQLLQVDEKVEFIDFKACYYALMVSEKEERVYPIWECYGRDVEKKEYRFWLDAFSGIVLAFELPYEFMGKSVEDIYRTMECIGKYYGYEVFGLAETITNMHAKESWQNALLLLDDAGNKETLLYMFKLGERWMFNVYPSSGSILGGNASSE